MVRDAETEHTSIKEQARIDRANEKQSVLDMNNVGESNRTS